MRGRKKIDPTFADIVELSVSHFAYGKTVMSMNKKFHRSVDFIGEAITMGLKKWKIMRPKKYFQVYNQFNFLILKPKIT